MDVFKSHASQPVNTNMDIGGSFFSACHIREVSATWRSAPYKNCIIIFIQEVFQAINTGIELGHNTQIEDIIYFFIQYTFRQAECRNLAAHKTSAGSLFIIQVKLITKRGKVAGNS